MHDSLNELKRAVILKKLQQRNKSLRMGENIPIIGMADRNGKLPLSWAQQRLWFLERFDSTASAAYHLPLAIRLEGKIDRDALSATLNRIVARHEILRTRFADFEDEPVQIISTTGFEFCLQSHDLSNLPKNEQQESIEKIGSSEMSEPFDLFRGPLIRGRLLILSENEHVLLVTQHHIISDGWSSGVLVKEFGVLYDAFSQRQPDPLPSLSLQYADYALWQRNWLQGERLEQQIEFWKNRLAGAPGLLGLPADFPRAAQQSYQGGSVKFCLPVALTSRLRDLSRTHGATLFMVLLAGWSALLCRLSGQDDVVVGTAIANRQRVEFEPLIGFFVNALPLRVGIDSDLTVVQLIEQIKATTLEAYAYQDVPFEKIVEAINPPRNLGYSPIFQTMLTMANTPNQGVLNVQGLKISSIEAERVTAKFDLSVSFYEQGDELGCEIEYASSLFRLDTIHRFCSYLESVLSNMAAEPDQKVTRLPVLDLAERQKLLVEFNRTDVEFPQKLLAHQKFEKYAQNYSDLIALKFEGKELSYGELNCRANHLAHFLIGLGVRPDDRVALFLARGPLMVIGMLGILKAGGVYVPLDASSPADRLAFMINDSGPVALLTEAVLEYELPTMRLTKLIVLDNNDYLDIESRVPSVDNPDSNVLGLEARHLAYIIYTSGSTGTPKGVMIEHGGLINYLGWAEREYFRNGNFDSVVFSPLSFDATITCLYLPLINGGAVTLIPDGEELQTLELLLCEPHIWGLIKITPAHLAVLGKRLLEADVECRVQLFVIGGEALPLSTVLLWQGINPEIRLINEYGPTETVVGCVTYEISEKLESVRDVPIGRPIANTRIYILDALLQPVPLGVTGEIYIGGAGVARGYQNRPELTAERFIRDPFSEKTGARMYKTGDLGRWLPDGNIEYLGRNDFQVKIRGFRIELGEIEAKLAGCDGVRDAVVLAREDQPGDKRLVAYVIAQEGSELSAASLRAKLSTLLPEYMVPSAFVSVESYPLTPNGKLDRKALPAPDQLSVVSQAYEAPKGKAEGEIAQIWQELLGLERVGRHDHFFDLGGHSLLAVRFISRIRQVLGVEIALRDLFARPTVVELAQVLESAGEAAVPPIELADRSMRLPLSWAQQRLWFLDQLDHEASVAYHLPVALRLKGKLDRASLGAALDKIVARHEDLRTSFTSLGGDPAQTISPEETGFALAEHDLGKVTGHEQRALVERMVAAEACEPFELSSGPLIRGQLLRLAEEEHVLLVTQHHIISDGWSSGVLVREFGILYAAYSQGLPDPLPALTIQYADYALWQRQWLQGEVLDRQLGFWRSHLEGAPALLDLPTDRARPSKQSYRGGTVAVTLSAQLSTGIREMAQRHGVTPFMALLAGWSVLLSRLSGQDDLVIGTPVANRQRAEIESLIGFFVNTLALRVRLEGDPSTGELLAQVKAAALDAYAHQDIPFEQVVEAVKPPRSMSHSPLFQVMLAFDNTPRAGELTLPGLTLEAVEMPHVTAHFDLSLSLTEQGGVIGGSLEYASDLFDRSTIERYVEYFQRLLGGMVADDKQKVSCLPLLSAQEREQLLVQFNDTAVEYPQDKLIHQLFEEQVERSPNATAVVFGDRELSYAQLNAKANQLAHHLKAMGVGPEKLVAVCVERGTDMVVALLAILKAGGAYVPLDPSYPTERLAYMLEDCAPALLLTESRLQAILPGTGLATVHLDTQSECWLGYIDLCVPDTFAPEHLAYLIYTSGSTGKPKACLLTHSGLSNMIQGHQHQLKLEAGSVVLQFSSIGFDVATCEIFMALCSGAVLHVVAKEIVRSGSSLSDYAYQKRITHAMVPPAILPMLDVNKWESVRHLVVGGESCPIDLAHKWAKHRAFYNAYGPSETTVCASMACLTPDAAVIHMGRPMPGVRIYILDEQRQPVPLNTRGEIYIGGAGVGRGYLHQQELTAQRFLDDPFSAFSGAKMYRTGDIGQWKKDGTIVFVGRNDLQVKIRGFRIELGEIEAQLRAQDGINQAAVKVTKGSQGEKRLVAYVVLNPGATLQKARLREALSGVLAEYMLPSAFVQLAQLPQTLSGKLDRDALPESDQDAYVAEEYEMPQGSVEVTLAEIWQTVLGIEKVGRTDNFFALGGHSLMAVKLIEQLRLKGMHAKVNTLFAAPTIEKLAKGLTLKSEFVAPPNSIADQSDRITPDMLPMMNLTELEIEAAIKEIPGGVGNIQDMYPLGPLQQGILFHHLMTQRGDLYLTPMLLSFDNRGRLDGFLQALQAVIDRHDILRTAIVWQNVSQPIQVVLRIAPLHVEEVVFDQSIGDVAAQLSQSHKSGHYRLDLGQAPLLRAILSHDVSRGRWVLQILAHHIVGDHVGLETIVEEIQLITQKREAELKKAMPFRNFIAHTNFRISETDHERFFTSMLRDIEEPTAPFGLIDFTTDHLDNAEYVKTVGEPLVGRLQMVARNLGVSCASVMHVIWAQVLARTSRQTDIVFGTVMSGRSNGGEGIDRAVGMFINTLPIRIIVNGQNVREVITQTHRSLTELMEYDHVPLTMVQRCSGVAAPLPLFTALLNYRHSRTAGTGFINDEVIWLGAYERSTYPLTLSVDDTGDDMIFTVQASSHVNPESVCAYVLTTMRNILDALEDVAPVAMSRIEVLNEEERKRLLFGWNATEVPRARQVTLHGLFDEQARMVPTKVALISNERCLTYGEIRRSAKCLASKLQEIGARPNRLIGVLLEKGWEQVVAVLGALYSGAAYLPLDPELPAERVRQILRHAEVSIVLTKSGIVEKMDGFTGDLAIVDMDLLRNEFADFSDSNEVPDSADSDLAYVIYTSGSTGVPKGVAIDHRAVVNTLLDINERFAIGPNDRVIALSSLSFDLSVFDIFGSLAAGAAIVIPDQAFNKNPQHWLEMIEAHDVTVWNSVPTLLNMLVEHVACKVGLSRSLRLAMLSGDWIPLTLPARFKSVFPHAHLEGLGGATEASIWSISFPIDEVKEDWRSIPYGRPLANQRIYVLDSVLRPAPIGVSGDLYIGGAGLAKEYWRDEERTAASFFIHPLSGERLYKTGDLGRWFSDGNIELLGRLDYQVKIRGFRIELGEIEAKLAGCDGVREAVVLAREDQPGDKRLVAYVIAQEGSELSAASLRAKLSTLLPEYMVPSAFVSVESYPLTPNGKLDRKALPAPDQLSVVSQAYEAPKGKAEGEIAQIWQELLGLERVGRHDHFFDLGGHSLLAVRFISRIRQVLGVEIALRDLFARPTVVELAQVLESAGEAAVPPIELADRSMRLPLSWAQQRLWFLDQMNGVSAQFNIPQVLRIVGEIDILVAEQVFVRIIERHESLRTVYKSDGESVWQVVRTNIDFTISVLDLRNLPKAERDDAVRKAAQIDASTPFDLTNDLMVRASFLRTCDDEGALLFNTHHIAADGLSMGILVDEFMQLYGAFSKNESDFLEPLPIQYADYAKWQQERLSDESANEQLYYWKRQLDGIPAVHSLQLDYPRPEMQSFEGAVHHFSVDAQLGKALKELGQSEQATLMMVLYAAFSLLISRHSNSDDIVMGAPVANRSQKSLENLIGLFVNPLVLRIDCSGDPTFREYVARAKKVIVDALTNQDVPFDYLVQHLQPERTVKHAPMYQIVFNMIPSLGGDRKALQNGGLSFLPIAGNHRIAKNELQINADEHEGVCSFSFEYNTDLFAPITISRLAGRFVCLLRGIVGNPAERIKKLPLLDDEELHLLVHGMNSTYADFPRDKCVHEIFEEQVAQTPGNVAVVCGGERLTYAELNQKSNQLAHYLREQGVAHGTLVALFVDRSLEAIIGMMAVLKAGGAYVPLDQAYPRDRLTYMLSDTAPSVLITQDALQDELPIVSLTRVIVMDDSIFREELKRFSSENLSPLGVQSPVSLANIIYTSGSSGQPKGVMVEHRGIVNLAQYQRTLFDVRAESCVMLFASLSFDAATSEWAMTLLGGASLYIATDEQRKNPLLLEDYLIANEITHVTLPPAMLRYLSSEKNYFLRSLIVAGEACEASLVKKWAGKCRFFNAYGPTEATVCASAIQLHPDERMSIGKPISNTRLYVLDGDRQPAPLGVAGELHIAGEGLTRGYWQKPELTAASFLDNPFVTNDRMYKTGDLVRYSFNGNLEFLGRVDNQVKIRGFRVELGEIEAAIATATGAAEVAVVACQNESGDMRLAAYVAMRDGNPLSTLVLRRQLSTKLSEYMIPMHFIEVPALPLTPNGKLDRKALPAPDQLSVVSQAYEAPKGKAEGEIAQIWQELLGLERVGRHDHFFDLGGHSLLAAQVLMRLKITFDIEISLQTFFEMPVVWRLGEILTDAQLALFPASEIDELEEEIALLSKSELLAILSEDDQDA